MPSLLTDLLEPSSLPDSTQKVLVVQTHISIVFVAEAFVYKVKKPVNFGFLDFSTLEKRKYYCQQEVKLNRRLSKNLYVDVLPITFDGQRHHVGGESGEIVEYAIKMRRIPEDWLMKAIYERGELNKGHLEGLAKVLADFHATADRSEEIETYGRPEKVRVNTDENFVQIAKYIGFTVSHDDFCALRDWTEGFYTSFPHLFQERIQKGRIRDCHGDLHMEHICLTEGFPIFDCIEFNDRFRYADTLSDIAFLLMDLDYHGGQYWSLILWDAYRRQADEREEEPLIPFYKAYRAVVRGKVNSFQLDDGAIDAEGKKQAQVTAQRYFALARSYIC